MQYNKIQSEMTAHPSRHFFFWDWLFPISILAFATLIFNYTKLDIAVQSLFYHPQSGWFLKEQPFFRFLYHYGNIPALLTAILGLLLTGLSYRTYKMAKWRKVGFFLSLAMILGPGLIINAALKDNWGRPRPRDVIEFGGKYQYEKVLTIDRQSKGESFPCGHASMGFFLMLPWFILRKKKPRTAFFCLWTGLFYGLLIGFARMIQAGHFLSDVIWSGGIVYLTGSALYLLTGLKKGIWYYSKGTELDRRQKTILSVIVGIFIVLLILAVILATPYSKTKSYSSLYKKDTGIRSSFLSLNCGEADLIILPADSLHIAYDAAGFGFPGSKLKNKFQEVQSGLHLFTSFQQRKKGYFSELNNNLKVYLPRTDSTALDLRIKNGTLNFSLPVDFPYLTAQLKLGKGTATILIPDTLTYSLVLKGNYRLTNLLRHPPVSENNSRLRITLELASGEVILKGYQASSD